MKNIGTVTSAATTTRCYLSAKTSKSGGHLLTGSRAMPSLPPSATSSGTVAVTVSAGTDGRNLGLLTKPWRVLLVSYSTA